MKTSTAALLILLRLAIGWHFLFEGLHKIHTHHVGVTATNRPFSSAGYLREAPGPLGKVARRQIGDPDEQALAELTPLPIPAGQDPATYPPQNRMPPALKARWEDYLARFEGHYGLTDQQKALAQAKLEQAEANVVRWLSSTAPDKDTKEVTKTYPTGTVTEKLTVPERVEEYRAALKEVREAVDQKMWAFGRDVEGKRLQQGKTEAAKLRVGLMSDLDEHTDNLKKALNDVLTPEQREQGPVSEPQPRSAVLQERLDFVTMWALTIIGGCLLIGLLTRINCLLAAGFLLTTYLFFPPYPWLPTPPTQEGYYLFVNKNLIEMLALLVIATVPTGRWFGVDGLLLYLALALRGRRPAAPVVRRVA